MGKLSESIKKELFQTFFDFKQSNARALGISRPLQKIPQKFLQKYVRNVLSLAQRPSVVRTASNPEELKRSKRDKGK